MHYCLRWVSLVAVALFCALPAQAQEWRSEPLSTIDRQYMEDQRETLDELARTHLGRQLSGEKDNDFTILQRLLDQGVVGQDDVSELQAMGLILGDHLKKEYGLSWAVYYDERGRSRSLQVPGFEEDFIFPITQISRRAEVGIDVNVRDVYKELEQAVDNIRNQPPL